MANIKSQIKRNRQSLDRRARNKAVRTRVRTRIRRFRAAVDQGDRDAATAALAEASRQLDKAASKGVLHRNRAADKKSRLAKELARL